MPSKGHERYVVDVQTHGTDLAQRGRTAVEEPTRPDASTKESQFQTLPGC